ncbi:hypothetical protein WM94_21645 [Pseudomonas sp. ABFPK]|nr:hypothetical protein WM94_21645 [Pseudomonas sp. ABFPK]
MTRLAKSLGELVIGMDYVLYAPQPVDKQLTAKVAMANLGDHFKAFLNANNVSNWAQDDCYLLRDDKVADVLILLSTTKGMTVGQLKYQGKKLIKLVAASGGKLRQMLAYRMVANCLGYETYEFALSCRSVDDYIDNLWVEGMVAGAVFLDESALMSWPTSAMSVELRKRVEFNKKRGKLLRALRSIDKRERTARESAYVENERKKLKRRRVPLEFKGS